MARVPKEQLRSEWITDRAGIAHILGVSQNWVSGKGRAQGLPRMAYGQYDAAAVVQWALERARAASDLDPDQLPDVVEARVELIKAQTYRTKIDGEYRARNLLDVEDVELRAYAIAETLASGYQAASSRLIAEIRASDSDESGKAVLDQYTRSQLEAFSEGFQTLAEDCSRDRSDPGAAAEPESG